MPVVDLIPWFTLWFVMTGGGGFITPMQVRFTDTQIIKCGIDGPIVGVQVNTLENPTLALWTDPHDGNKHCEVDISARVASLPVGQYHNAATYMGVSTGIHYLSPDPHTSPYWIKSNAPENRT